MKKAALNFQKKYLLIVFTLSLMMSACIGKSSEGIHYAQKDERPPSAAKILGQDIDMADLLEGSNLEYYQLQDKEYRFKKNQLDRLVQEKILQSEAKKANIGVEELLNKQILKGPVKVSSSEVDQFIKEKNIDKNQVDATARKQMEDFLIAQKREKKISEYLGKLTKTAPIEVYFKRPSFILSKEKVVRPTVGYTNAKIKLIEVVDYQCESCRTVSNKIELLRKKYGRDIEVSYLYFPGEKRNEGRLSAEAAICGFRIKPEAFWDFHVTLMALTKPPEKNDVINLAAKLGMDKNKFAGCLQQKEGDKDLAEHFSTANKMGVRSSPLIILNGEVILPDASMSDIEAKVKDWISSN